MQAAFVPTGRAVRSRRKIAQESPPDQQRVEVQRAALEQHVAFEHPVDEFKALAARSGRGRLAQHDLGAGESCHGDARVPRRRGLRVWRRCRDDQSALQPALDEFTRPLPLHPYSIPRFPVTRRPLTRSRLTPWPILRPAKSCSPSRGTPTTPWFAPNFDFTVTQAFGLQPDGRPPTWSSATYVRHHELTRRPIEGRPGADRSQGSCARAERRQGRCPADVDADRNLGGFLRTLLTPARPDGPAATAAARVQPDLLGCGISPPVIVLRGALAVADRPQAHVEFEEIAATSGGPWAASSPNGTRGLGHSRAGFAGGAITVTSGSARARHHPASRTTRSSCSSRGARHR